MDTQLHSVITDIKDEETITNYHKFEAIYVTEEPVEETSQDLEECENVLQSIKKEECISDNDEQMDKKYHNLLIINNSTSTNYQNVEEIYIKEEPLETTSENCEMYESVKKEECRIDNNQIDKTCGNSITNSKGFYCVECNKSFARKSCLTRHMKIHTGEKDFQCSICNKYFRQKGTLTDHLKVHEGIKEYKCGICKKLFTVHSNLKNHMRTHSGMESDELRCPTCFKFFASYSHLKNHLKIHSGVKEYECTVCNKQFTQYSTLYNHMNLHTQEKVYRCTICNKLFSQSTSLTRHKKIHSRVKTS